MSAVRKRPQTDGLVRAERVLMTAVILTCSMVNTTLSFPAAEEKYECIGCMILVCIAFVVVPV